MKIIKELSRMIGEELGDAERYAKCATRWKDEDTRLGDTFYNLAKAELEHSNILHEQAVRLIEEYDGEVPVGMKAVWDYEHEKMMDDTARVKVLLEMYKS